MPTCRLPQRLRVWLHGPPAPTPQALPARWPVRRRRENPEDDSSQALAPPKKKESCVLTLNFPAEHEPFACVPQGHRESGCLPRTTPVAPVQDLRVQAFTHTQSHFTPNPAHHIHTWQKSRPSVPSSEQPSRAQAAELHCTISGPLPPVSASSLSVAPDGLVDVLR